MLKEERFDIILKQVEQDQKVTLEGLSQLLGVSSDTVRRDLKELSDNGLLKAVRGGAVRNLPLPYAERENIDSEDKRIIAKKVQQFIKSDMVIFIDAGTTTKSAALEIPKNMRLTVVTNSFPVVTALLDHPLVEVLFLGGQLNKRAFSTNGYETLQAIKNIQAHVCLLGICGLDLKRGVTGSDYQDTLVKKAMIENSRFKIALSTYEKVGSSDPYFVCETGALNVFITEKDPALLDIRGFKEAGVTIL
jgi:DeoR/GlpR family transcriptional regulator of sugar metabolism